MYAFGEFETVGNPGRNREKGRSGPQSLDSAAAILRWIPRFIYAAEGTSVIPS